MQQSDTSLSFVPIKIDISPDLRALPVKRRNITLKKKERVIQFSGKSVRGNERGETAQYRSSSCSN